MATTLVIDHWFLELEYFDDPVNSTLPIRACATNTANDTKTAETWWSISQGKQNLATLTQEHEGDEYWARLMDFFQLSLRPAKFNSRELVAVGFDLGDLEEVVLG